MKYQVEAATQNTRSAAQTEDENVNSMASRAV